MVESVPGGIETIGLDDSITTNSSEEQLLSSTSSRTVSPAFSIADSSGCTNKEVKALMEGVKEKVKKVKVKKMMCHNQTLK